MRNRLLVVFITAWACPNIILGQTAYTASRVKQLDSITTQDVPPGAPGIATAIIENGHTVYSKYCGYADFADSSLITEKTRFNLASNAKQFTALAILILLAEKKINISDDIRKFLPTLYPNIKNKITISNLLTHTSGIRDVYDLWSMQGLTWWEHTYNNKDVLELVQRQQGLNFLPNTNHLYSNTNYILLALIVEKITGQSFVQFTNQMFKQLNMPNTSFEDDYTKIRGPIGRAYFNFDTWTTYKWIWNVCGDGNLFSNLEDQIQWEKIIQGKAVSSIKKEVIQQSQQLTNIPTANNYGYGLETGKYKGLACKFHEGATGAWKATVIRFPHKNISMITLTNTGKAIPSMQTRQMADIVFNLKEASNYLVTRPSKQGAYVSEDEIPGTYLTGDNFTFQFEKTAGVLYLKRIGRNDIQLEREASNIFHQKFDTAFKQEFNITPAGEMEVTAYYTTHSPYTLKRTNSDWGKVDYTAINGKYWNAETNTQIELSFITGKNYVVKIGSQDSTTGLLIAPDKLLADNYTIVVSNKKPTTDTLLLNGNRIKNVKFIRQKPSF